VNVCCTGIVANPGFDASAVAPNKLIREASSSTIESARHTIRFLYGVLFVDIPVFLILIISS